MSNINFKITTKNDVYKALHLLLKQSKLSKNDKELVRKELVRLKLLKPYRKEFLKYANNNNGFHYLNSLLNNKNYSVEDKIAELIMYSFSWYKTERLQKFINWSRKYSELTELSHNTH